jgi:HPt (histidine-containing phosphotransfer) domain-containing protein
MGSPSRTIEVDVGPEAYAELLAVFRDNVKLSAIKLSRAAQTGDLPAARYVAHTLKGSAASFGATRLDECADRILGLGREQGDQLGTLLEEYDEDFVSV